MTLAELFTQLDNVQGWDSARALEIRSYTVAMDRDSNPTRLVTRVTVNHDQRVVWLHTN